MKDQNFSNREIVLMFEQIKLELDHIKEQTTKTNGRLLKAEDKIEGLNGFQIKAMTLYSIVLAVVVFAANNFL